MNTQPTHVPENQETEKVLEVILSSPSLTAWALDLVALSMGEAQDNSEEARIGRLKDNLDWMISHIINESLCDSQARKSYKQLLGIDPLVALHDIGSLYRVEWSKVARVYILLWEKRQASEWSNDKYEILQAKETVESLGCHPSRVVLLRWKKKKTEYSTHVQCIPDNDPSKAYCIWGDYFPMFKDALEAFQKREVQ